MNDLSARAERQNVVETRSAAYQGIELRALDDGFGGKTLRFTGYASVTESPYEMSDWLGDYSEVVRRGAFARTLAAGADVPFVVNHGGLTLARTKSGTLRLAEDSTGLHVEADLDPRSPSVLDLQVAMERGDVDEMSFGFRVTAQEWSPDWTQRDITEVDLNKGDVSAVNYGANPATAGATMRGRDMDAFLRSVPTDRLRRYLEELEAEAAPAPEAARAADLSLYSARLRALNI
ncbi:MULTISPECIES: HK97 family phage prohead protease [unclassified Kitasatospora]|uniref:HK97 family phage prohead protease n=1 Tax=unclassified Kitasatospora TaxID=2633591 RepID=UPI002472F190|nr:MULTISPECIES: HK97 family phage prohead protease [unclassified Kitasatospora]MDH6123867.1 HK97 family phage prohead protease [Kitasatospora sp. GP82]MDH6576034.1 HK97 family phage prohead protease [Kitasatospora sp. MAP5-34]